MAQGRIGLGGLALALAAAVLAFGRVAGRRPGRGADPRRAAEAVQDDRTPLLVGQLLLVGLGLYTLHLVGPASASLLLCLAVAAPRGPAPGHRERGLLVFTALVAAGLDLWALAAGTPATGPAGTPSTELTAWRLLNVSTATAWLLTAWPRSRSATAQATSSSDAIDGAIVSPAGFSLRARDEMARRRRHGQALSLLVAELDPVDGVSEHGEAARRAHLLQMLARTVRDIDTVAAGPDDGTARVLLPHTDAYGALALAERVRVAVGRSTWQENQRPVRLTVTVGSSTLRPGESFEDAMERAFAALRAGQRDGRNRVRGETGMADLLV